MRVSLHFGSIFGFRPAVLACSSSSPCSIQAANGYKEVRGFEGPSSFQNIGEVQPCDINMSTDIVPDAKTSKGAAHVQGTEFEASSPHNAAQLSAKAFREEFHFENTKSPSVSQTIGEEDTD